MKWIVGFFIWWLIETLLGSSSKNRDAEIRDFKKEEKTNRESAEKLLKDLDVTSKEKSKREITKVTPVAFNSSSSAQQALDEVPPLYDEIPPWIQDDAYDKIPSSAQHDAKFNIINAFNRYGISSVWHMTHKDNIREIISSGILSNKTAYEIKNPIDISDHGVQRWRESVEPIYGRQIHEYAPTYLNIKNPMLYVRRNIQHYLCLIEISLSVLSENEFIFTDGNAASRNTRFYNKIDDLDKLPWDVLNASYWNDFPDGKRKRCSEVLIYPMIQPRYIMKIYCCSSETYQYLAPFGVPVEISENLFFRKSLSGAASYFSSFDEFDNDIPF